MHVATVLVLLCCCNCLHVMLLGFPALASASHVTAWTMWLMPKVGKKKMDAWCVHGDAWCDGTHMHGVYMVMHGVYMVMHGVKGAKKGSVYLLRPSGTHVMHGVYMECCISTYSNFCCSSHMPHKQQHMDHSSIVCIPLQIYEM